MPLGILVRFSLRMNREQSYYAEAAFLLFLLHFTQTSLPLHTQADLGTSCHQNVTETKLQRD